MEGNYGCGYSFGEIWFIDFSLRSLASDLIGWYEEMGCFSNGININQICRRVRREAQIGG